LKIAYGFMPSGLQIDFRWKTCFIHVGNKDHINRTSLGWEIRTMYSCEFYVRLRSWIVGFWFSNLPMFIRYLKSISIEKIAILRLGMSTITCELIWLSIINNLLVRHIRMFEVMCLYFGSLHLILLLMSFKSISNDKLAIFILGIWTIKIGTQSVKI
jgi:hypothetical protein